MKKKNKNKINPNIKRDHNILLSYKHEIKMNTSISPPKKGKGAKYKRMKINKYKIDY